MTTGTGHPFQRDPAARPWMCMCGASRNSATHGKGTAAPVPRRHGIPVRTIPIGRVTPGTRLWTTGQVGDDFGLPLVDLARARQLRSATARTVRGRHRCQGGVVVWFTDRTKTRPVPGRTTCLVAPPEPGPPTPET